MIYFILNHFIKILDELLVLHQDTCVNTFVEKYPAAPVLLINWAFYIPELPLTEFGSTGVTSLLSEEHLQIIRKSSEISKIENDIILPHDMLLRRYFENLHVKSINRVSCTGMNSVYVVLLCIVLCLFFKNCLIEMC
jgi:hypothetical protein